MKFRSVSTLLLGIVLLFCAGCGDTYELQSIELAPSSFNILGIGGFKQVTVTAKYSNGKSKDVTPRTSYQITAPNGAPVAPAAALTISTSGRLQVVDGACTWTVITQPDDTKVYGTQPYILTATFDTKQSVAFISVNSLAGCDSPAAGSTSPVIYDLPEQYRR